MAEQSSMHLYLNWTKERIDEMDAALASARGQSQSSQGRESKDKADEIIADLKKRRDEFQALLQDTGRRIGRSCLGACQDGTGQAVERLEAQVETYFPKAPASRSSSSRPRSKDTRCRASKAWSEAADKSQVSGGQSGCGPTRRSRDRASADEVRCFRSRSTPAKAQPGGKRVMVGPEHWTYKSRKAFRSGQPGRVGRTEGSGSKS